MAGGAQGCRRGLLVLPMQSMVPRLVLGAAMTPVKPLPGDRWRVHWTDPTRSEARVVGEPWVRETAEFLADGMRRDGMRDVEVVQDEP